MADCTDYPTPEDAKRFKNNAGSVDEFVTSDSDTFVDQDGGEHITIEGINTLAETQRDQFDATFQAQFTYKHIGNISDYVGDSLSESEKLNSYQYPDDSGEWYGPIQSQTFPIIIPADPSSDEGWVLTSNVSKQWVAETVSNTNLLSNHNFIIASPDDSQPAPSATPTSYPPGYEIFSGVFANETTGILNLTYIDGRVSFSGGDFYIPRANSKELENITEFVASVADFDGKPRTRGVSYALVGDEYRVTVGIDALEDAGSVLTPLGSVKFEQGSVATRHEVGSLNSFNLPSELGYKTVAPTGGDQSQEIQEILDAGIPVQLLPFLTYRISTITVGRGGVLHGFGRNYTRLNVIAGGNGVVTIDTGSITQTQARVGGFQILGEDKNTSNGWNNTNCAHCIFEDVWIRNCNDAMYLNDALLNTYKDFYLQGNNRDMWFDPNLGTNLNSFYNFKLNSSVTGILIGKESGPQVSTQCYGNTFYDIDIEKETLALDVRTGSTASPALIIEGGVFEAESATVGMENRCRITGDGRVNFKSIILGDVSKDPNYKFITDDSDGEWNYDDGCTVTTSANSFVPCKKGRYDVDTPIQAISDTMMHQQSEHIKAPIIESLSSSTGANISSYVFGSVSPDLGFDVINLINSDTGGTGEQDPIGGTSAFNRTTTLTKSGSAGTGTANQPVTLQVFVKVVGSSRKTFTLNYNNNGATVASKTYTYRDFTGWCLAYLVVPADLVTTDVHQFQLFGPNDLHIWHPQMCVGIDKVTPPMSLLEEITQPVTFNGYLQKNVTRRSSGPLNSGQSIYIPDLCTVSNTVPTYQVIVNENINASSRVTTVYNATLILTRINDADGVQVATTQTTGIPVAKTVNVTIDPLTSGSDKGLRFTATTNLSGLDISVIRIS